ncbi:MAG: DNA-directed RNA polymerase subunit alpha [Alphaproteobacteria bacterium]|nr:DNA-directed RNA polymerase subunit alpha [Alphaproteobacteria bacterium]MBL0718188.1 DNA-directed RNA polymerase subunit alpha [Alphaproteobacteria bacterium]
MLQENWKALQKPEETIVNKNDFVENTSTVILRPLEKGMGQTLGVALRRILLSSLQGTAIRGICIEGVEHEFSVLNGLKEDVVNLILNLKEVIFQAKEVGDYKLSLDIKGPKVITSNDIVESNEVSVVNKEVVLCSIEKDASIKMDIFITTGKGYKSYDENRRDNDPVGFMPVDSMFSPIKNVELNVNTARVGEQTDLDELELTVATNGSITPEEAIALSARILVEQFSALVNFDDPIEEIVEEEETPSLPFDPMLLKKVEDLELSVRANNCLKNDNIVYIGELIQRTEASMLKTPNFGRKSLCEIKSHLEGLGFGLGIDVPEFPKSIEGIEELIASIKNSSKK